VGKALFFGLPGNPASSMVSFELFVRPALRALAGRQRLHRPRVQARLLAPVAHTPGREEYARASTYKEDDGFVSRAAEGQESHRFRPMITANSLLLIASERGTVEAGEILPAIMTEWPEI
jgi:molybdopterin molybdotransferase